MNKPPIPWPDTERRFPEGVQLSIRYVHSNWGDLCWWNDQRKCWVYLSTLSKEQLTEQKIS